jgi:hypothetical protein
MRVDTSLHAIAGFSVQDQACRAREASLGSGRLSGAAKVPGVVNVATPRTADYVLLSDPIVVTVIHHRGGITG